MRRRALDGRTRRIGRAHWRMRYRHITGAFTDAQMRREMSRNENLKDN